MSRFIGLKIEEKKVVEVKEEKPTPKPTPKPKATAKPTTKKTNKK